MPAAKGRSTPLKSHSKRTRSKNAPIQKPICHSIRIAVAAFRQLSQLTLTLGAAVGSQGIRPARLQGAVEGSLFVRRLRRRVKDSYVLSTGRYRPPSRQGSKPPRSKAKHRTTCHSENRKL